MSPFWATAGSRGLYQPPPPPETKALSPQLKSCRTSIIIPQYCLLFLAPKGLDSMYPQTLPCALKARSPPRREAAHIYYKTCPSTHSPSFPESPAAVAMSLFHQTDLPNGHFYLVEQNITEAEALFLSVWIQCKSVIMLHKVKGNISCGAHTVFFAAGNWAFDGSMGTYGAMGIP